MTAEEVEEPREDSGCYFGLFEAGDDVYYRGLAADVVVASASVTVSTLQEEAE